MTILYKITVSIPNAPLLIQRHYSVTSAADAKAIMAYAQAQGLEATVQFARHDTEYTACKDIDRELRLAARRKYA